MIDAPTLNYSVDVYMEGRDRISKNLINLTLVVNAWFLTMMELEEECSDRQTVSLLRKGYTIISPPPLRLTVLKHGSKRNKNWWK